MKPNREEVRRYFEKKGIYLSEEDSFRIEKDFRNMPLCLYMLENPLSSSKKGYCNKAEAHYGKQHESKYEKCKLPFISNVIL